MSLLVSQLVLESHCSLMLSKGRNGSIFDGMATMSMGMLDGSWS